MLQSFYILYIILISVLLSAISSSGPAVSGVTGSDASPETELGISTEPAQNEPVFDASILIIL